MPSGAETVLHNRASWAVCDLFQAGLLHRIKRGTYAISDAGKNLLAQQPDKITRELLKHFPSFLDYLNRSNQNPNEKNDQQQILLDHLLDELKRTDPVYFERIILDLFKAMHYGEGQTTPKSHDGGIDGIIFEDGLGLSKIYMQAKRYADSKVNEKEVQNFVGALGCSEVSKGVFITTSLFDEKAKKKALDAAKKGMIIRLIDGQELTKLMIEHNVGVRTIRTIEIKIVDTAYFISPDE